MAKRVNKAPAKEGKPKRRKQDDVEEKQDFFLMDDDNKPAASESEEEEAEETAEEKRLRLGRSYSWKEHKKAGMPPAEPPRTASSADTAGLIVLPFACSSGLFGAYSGSRRGRGGCR